MKSQQIQKWYRACRQPENLVFLDNDELLQISEERSGFSVGQLQNVAAESLIRYYFNPIDEHREVLTAWLSDQAADSISNLRICLKNGRTRQLPTLFKPQSPFEKQVERLARTRLETLLGKVDGLIPVCCQDKGYAIPFVLENPGAAGLSDVVDLDDVQIPEWTISVQKLNLDKPCRVRLMFHSSGLPFTCLGDSLQLPVLMAAKRKADCLPEYDPFMIAATGKVEFDKREGCGRIVPVKVSAKFEYLKNRYANITFVCPETTTTDLPKDMQSLILEPALPLNEAMNRCTEFMEKNNLCSRFNIQYIINRLPRYSERTRKDLEKRWDDTIATLEKYKEVLDEDDNPDEYIELLLTISFACCHAGRTAQAREYNRQAAEIAQQENRNEALVRLEIGELVLLQDEENFSPILDLKQAVYERLQSLNSGSDSRFDGQNDLYMRYHGTMGQAHLFGTVLGLPGFNREEAMTHIKKAIQFANELEQPDDIARDKNYRHLWYALFEPESAKESEFYRKSYNYIQANLSAESVAVNLAFLTRQRGLAAARAVLLKGQTDIELDEITLLDPDIQKPWLPALAKKYQGVWHASKGNVIAARACFDEGQNLLESSPNPLFRFFRMTIAAQAYWSFSNAGEADLADGYRRVALNMFADNDNFDLYPSSERWLKYVERDAFDPNDEFPGRNYYY